MRDLITKKHWLWCRHRLTHMPLAASYTFNKWLKRPRVQKRKHTINSKCKLLDVWFMDLMEWLHLVWCHLILVCTSLGFLPLEACHLVNKTIGDTLKNLAPKRRSKALAQWLFINKQPLVLHQTEELKIEQRMKANLKSRKKTKRLKLLMNSLNKLLKKLQKAWLTALNYNQIWIKSTLKH